MYAIIPCVLGVLGVLFCYLCVSCAPAIEQILPHALQQYLVFVLQGCNITKGVATNRCFLVCYLCFMLSVSVSCAPAFGRILPHALQHLPKILGTPTPAELLSLSIQCILYIVYYTSNCSTFLW